MTSLPGIIRNSKKKHGSLKTVKISEEKRKSTSEEKYPSKRPHTEVFTLDPTQLEQNLKQHFTDVLNHPDFTVMFFFFGFFKFLTFRAEKDA